MTTEHTKQDHGGKDQGHKSHGDKDQGSKLIGKPFFQRKKSCPFSGPKAHKIDYKDVRMLGRYISPLGKIMPRHMTGVSTKKQRELTQAIKRARALALLPYKANVN